MARSVCTHLHHESDTIVILRVESSQSRLIRVKESDATPGARGSHLDGLLKVEVRRWIPRENVAHPREQKVSH